MSKLCEFLPFKSVINASFWHKLTQLKLDVDKLNENERIIWGYVSNYNAMAQPILEVDSTSFNENPNILKNYIPVHGKLFNKNTIETFKNCDKGELVQSEGVKLWKLIQSDDVLDNPSLLNTFLVLSFADLKKYHYYYWFAFPSPSGIDLVLDKVESVECSFSNSELEIVIESYMSLDVNQRAFFIINNEKAVCTVHDYVKGKDANCENYYYAYAELSSSREYASWPLRNYAAFLLHRCPSLHGKSVKFLALSLSKSGDAKSSRVICTVLPNFQGDAVGWFGWERNERGNLGPRMANMKNSIDPKSLAESSVDLNLKLMKWRLLPKIDLDGIKNLKCLLLGSGTLGCTVARCLLGWGVRNITFVDNSTVSFSNPVRQSLFDYDDCVKNSPKSEAAARNLRRIFPNVISTGYQLTIPMPGHPIGECMLDQTKETVDKLTSLVTDSDVIFLLTDSRESRWLPTLLAMQNGKLVINAALGFDTYLVMRHGVRQVVTDFNQPSVEHLGEGIRMIRGSNLGCYFCNDVTAPGNSIKDRTLDQQCTVTRPGVSHIAGALAVELAVSVIQHEQGIQAPAYYHIRGNLDHSEENECILGLVPHSIRGFLTNFSQVLPATEKYAQCIACSDTVLSCFNSNGFDFLLEAFNSSKYLEDVTGLSAMHQEMIDACDDWDLSETEED